MDRFLTLLVVMVCFGVTAGTEAHPSASMSTEITVADSTENAFGHPLPALNRNERRSFFVGNSFFRQNWVIAPASTAARDGLGPLFNARSCSACHFKDGRGSPPSGGSDFLALVLRVSVAEAADPSKGVAPHPVYGAQLQQLAIPGADPEGRPVVEYEERPGLFPDGSTYSLRHPRYRVEQPHYGKPGEDFLLSPRIAPHLIGMGLLEAIREEDLMALADPEDSSRNGISGRPNRVWDAKKNHTVPGRFGWKANTSTIHQQTAAAFVHDIGITSSLFPEENITGSQTALTSFPTGGEPEISDAILQHVVFYTQALAVPRRRNIDSPEVRRGEAVFGKIGCADCHHPSYLTGEHPTLPAASNQIIHPYTDLLLHDMGEELADGRPDFEATGSEWRTPPLWGIGLFPSVNGHTFYLHDGRARSLEEAVLWHGGEAETSKNAYKHLPLSEREALQRFLESL